MANQGLSGFGRFGGGLAPAVVLLAEDELLSSRPTVELEVPEGFSHLEMLYIMRCSAAATSAELYVQFNDDAGANYDIVLSQTANGSHTGGARAAQTAAYIATVVGDTATAGVPTHGKLVIPYYRSSTFQHGSMSWANHKQGTAVGNLYEFFASQWWRATAPIYKLTLTLSAGSFMVGSEFSLYGIR